MSADRRRERLLKADTNILLAALIFVSIAFTLLIIGYASPGWYVVEYDLTRAGRRDVARAGKRVNSVHHGGLWYDVYCASDACEVYLKTDNQFVPKEFVDEVSEWWLEYKVEATVALGVSLLALIFAIVSRRTVTATKKKFLLILLALFFTCLISGVTALVASGKIGDIILEQHLDHNRHSPFIFPYSCFVFGLGGAFMCIASLLVFATLVRFPINLKSDEWEDRPSVVVAIAENADTLKNNGKPTSKVNAPSKIEVVDTKPDSGATVSFTQSSNQLSPGLIPGMAVIHNPGYNSPPAQQEHQIIEILSDDDTRLTPKEDNTLPNQHQIIEILSDDDCRSVSKVVNTVPAQHQIIEVLSDNETRPGQKVINILPQQHQVIDFLNEDDIIRPTPKVINTVPQPHDYQQCTHQRIVYSPSSSVYIHQPGRQYFTEYLYHSSQVQKPSPVTSNGQHRLSGKQVEFLGAL